MPAEVTAIGVPKLRRIGCRSYGARALLRDLEPQIGEDTWKRVRSWVENAKLYRDGDPDPSTLDVNALTPRGPFQVTACFAEGAVFSAIMYAPDLKSTVRAIGVSYSGECRFEFPKSARWDQQLALLGISPQDANVSRNYGGRESIAVPARNVEGGTAWILVEAS